MVAHRISSPAALIATCLLACWATGARAEGAADAHRSWQTCLGHAYNTGIASTGRDLAADAAFRTCRGEEGIYLTALSASPLLDGDDIAQARPELVARARTRLLATLAGGPRAILR